jgi:hypothetical protein
MWPLRLRLAHGSLKCKVRRHQQPKSENLLDISHTEQPLQQVLQADKLSALLTFTSGQNGSVTS